MTPTTRGMTGLVLGLLDAHPGRAWRPTEVADALQITTHQAALILLALANRGEVLRFRYSKARSVYSSRKEPQ